jgi:hypothetical protein
MCLKPVPRPVGFKQWLDDNEIEWKEGEFWLETSDAVVVYADRMLRYNYTFKTCKSACDVLHDKPAKKLMTLKGIVEKDAQAVIDWYTRETNVSHLTNEE